MNKYMEETMKILVIGGTGFLGSHIVNKLIDRNYDVYVLTRNISKDMLFDKSKVTLIQGDIRNLDFLTKLFLILGD